LRPDAKNLGLEKEILFVGGVSKNSGVKRALEEFLGIEFAPIACDPQIVGVLGAALIAKKDRGGRYG